MVKYFLKVLAMHMKNSEIFLSVRPFSLKLGKTEPRTKMLTAVLFITAKKLEITEMLQNERSDKQIKVHSKEKCYLLTLNVYKNFW
jgi:hypothetical protein